MTNFLRTETLLTTAQVARRRGVCRETVNRAAREGRLEFAMKLPGGPNGAYLFEESAVIDWICPGDRLPGL